MGVVYRASQEHVDREVAIKVLQPERGGDDDAAAQFLGEAQAIGQLSSPHTVTFIDAGPLEEGGWYLVMELLDGETLHQRLANASLEPDEAIRIADQIALSLSEAHARGLVHRDLKPSNVFLAQTPGHAEVAKVLDFGLASTALEGKGNIAGTPRYMAPEAIAGTRPKPTADVYALGLMLYEMIAGAHPFADLEGDALLAAQLDTVPDALDDEKVPSAVRMLVARCLAKSPKMRFRDGKVLREALREAAGLPADDAARPRTSSPNVGVAAPSTMATMPSTLSIEALRARLLGEVPWWRRWYLPAAVVLGGVLLFLGLRSETPTPTAPTPPERSASAPAPNQAPRDGAPPIPAASATNAPAAYDVLFHTIPDGASVFIDDQRFGPTPVVIPMTAPTEVELRLEGYESAEQEVIPSSGLRVRHEFVRPKPKARPDPVGRRVDHYLD